MAGAGVEDRAHTGSTETINGLRHRHLFAVVITLNAVHFQYIRIVAKRAAVGLAVAEGRELEQRALVLGVSRLLATWMTRLISTKDIARRALTCDPDLSRKTVTTGSLKLAPPVHALPTARTRPRSRRR